jgi:hypothetical protein
MVARWTGIVTATGDATAGLIEAGIYFGAEANAIYGGRLLWDLRSYCYEVNAAIAVSNIYIYTGERSSYPLAGGLQWKVTTGTAATMSATYHTPPKMKWRVSNLPTELTRVYFEIPNVNLTSLTCHFSGYLYDEALI